MKNFIIRVLFVIFLTSLSSLLLWHYYTYSDSARSGPKYINQNPANNKDSAASNPRDFVEKPAKRKTNVMIDKLLETYSSSWKKQEKNFLIYRHNLRSSCNAIYNAVVTQENSPVGANITYDANKRKILEVSPDLFSIFPKETPFKNAPWDTCAVVGNGGILANSSCGEQIDSATFVIRCNLPPLNGCEKDTGIKSNLVTANPSILFEKYRGLNEHRRSFVKNVQIYGDALLLLPAFSYPQNTAVCLRAVYSLEDFDNRGPKPGFYNPAYLSSLAEFWRGQGIRARRLSTGIMMVSLALELCNNVHLYGFWPFGIHPYNDQTLTNHYYDNRPANNRVHAMPAEFEALLNLHKKGVIHLHLGECSN